MHMLSDMLEIDNSEARTLKGPHIGAFLRIPASNNTYLFDAMSIQMLEHLDLVAELAQLIAIQEQESKDACALVRFDHSAQDTELHWMIFVPRAQVLYH